MRLVFTLGFAATFLLAVPAIAAAKVPDLQAAFVASCQSQMYMSAPACTCMAGIAAKKLDANAMTYLSLRATDVTHSAAMAKSMSAAEVSSIDAFMRTAPGQCKDAK